jgi:phosphatidyl-myo-inositol alpha-mannosyltransferase
MKIVQVCPYSWSARGGVQTHVRHLSRHLSERGHEVLVLAAGPTVHGGTGVQPTVASGDTFTGPKVQTVGASICVPFNGSRAPICVQLQSARIVRRALRQFQPDVVHVHEPFVPGLSLSAVWFAEAPVVATFHAYCPPSLDDAVYSLAARWLRPICRRVTARLGVSEAAARCAASKVGGTVRVIPNGIDVELFARAHPAPLPPGRKLLFVGRLDRRKGFDVAVRAFAHLCERYDDLTLLVAGAGPGHDDVNAVPPAVRRRISMWDDIDDGQLPAMYAAADVFIAPAIGHESFGTVLLEAMAAGRPIVASDIEGYREVVRADVDALVVGPRDAEALAKAVGRILDTPSLARRLSLSARDRVKQFAWDVVAKDIERTYAVVAGGQVVIPAA